MFAKKGKKTKTAHILHGPKSHKICSSAANRKPLKDSVICRRGRGVTPLGSQWTNGKGAFEGSVVRRGSEVACVRGGGGKRNGSLAAGPDVSTLCVGGRMDKRQNMSVREWACVKDVFAPTFSSAAQGGYSHCLEVFSCVPLGPTRRLVTHLKVSFSVVQHHLKN